MIDTDKCWLFAGKLVRGYGRVTQRIDGKEIGYPAHRLTYEKYVGVIPDGLVIDHLCRVRSCINPSHLEAVTSRENSLRGIGEPAKNAVKTHCPQGHEYTPDNIIYKYKKRYCRNCQNAYLREYSRRRWREQNPLPV